VALIQISDYGESNERQINTAVKLVSLLLPVVALAGETTEILSAPKSLNSTPHIINYLSITVTVLAYVAAMSEEVIPLHKSASPNR
jgi:hypothetical protein